MKNNVITFNDHTYETRKANLVNAQLIFENGTTMSIFAFSGSIYKDTPENEIMLKKIQKMTKAITTLQQKQNNLMCNLEDYNLV
jgi:hypothetical protein